MVRKQANFKIDVWLRDLEAIQSNIVYLRFNNTDFKALADRFNKKRLEPYLWEFAKRNYITYMSMAIRRLVDNHRDARSLWKLIDDIEFNSEAFSRQWFLTQWAGGEHETPFLEFFGSSPVLQKSVISGHKLELETVTKSIRDRADKFEAHIDKKPKLKSIPTFNDIDNSVEIIAKLYKKYYYLLKQASLTI